MTEDREIKPSEGKCWKNAEKTESWHGDYKGTFVMPDGTKHFLDLYVNKMADGQAWFKIKVGKAKTSQVVAQAAAPAAKVALLDEDIPFN
jgi:hypothetical protein